MKTYFLHNRVNNDHYIQSFRAPSDAEAVATAANLGLGSLVRGTFPRIDRMRRVDSNSTLGPIEVLAHEVLYCVD